MTKLAEVREIKPRALSKAALAKFDRLRVPLENGEAVGVAIVLIMRDSGLKTYYAGDGMMRMVGATSALHAIVMEDYLHG